MKRIIIAVVAALFAGSAGAWCLPGYTEAPDKCNAGLVYCLAPGQAAPTSCDAQKQQQQQAQQQSQGQNQSQSSRSHSDANSSSTSTSSARGGAGGAGGAGGGGGTASTDSHAVSLQQTTTQGGTATGGGAALTFDGGTTNDYAAKVPVNTAIAPTVITGSDQCLVPISASAQGVLIGVAVGTAKDDPNCQALKLSAALKGLGQYAAAVEVLAIQDPRVREALKNVGGYVPVVDAAHVRPSLKHNEFEGRDIVNVQVPAIQPGINISPQH